MNDHGKLGEDYAASMLEQAGYRILQRNFRSRYGEIDLIATKGEILAFVEVKTRAANFLAQPGAAVSLSKQRKLIRTAQYYLFSHGDSLQPRFDVAEIITETPEVFTVSEAVYLENAFWVNEQNSGGSYRL